MTCLLTTSEMYAADKAAVASGVPSLTLMENAGWQVARTVRQAFAPRQTLVLCGPGNNGGDGFVAARYLAQWGWPVRVALIGEITGLRGDAAAMAKRWNGGTVPLSTELLNRRPLVIDAMFGAGLARPLEGEAFEMVEALNAGNHDVVAVDVPSGLNGDTGELLGAAPRAAMTVTFFRPKPGHALMPGRALCGGLRVTDIGIPDSVLDAIKPKTALNRPELWSSAMPRLRIDGHKFDRGHLLVAGGATMTGAARLAAQAARRIGAGLVTLVAPDETLAIYRSGPPGLMARSSTEWPELLADKRRNACVIGPGLGAGDATKRLVLEALAAGKVCVIDADAITSFADDASTLWRAGGTKILTPHEGEYARLFKHAGDRLARARAAAAESGAIMLLKGPDTVVAAPDGRAAISVDAPPSLATGGSGDVLAGLIGGLAAQGMDPYLAACAAVWLHGAAARRHGPGLIAEDLVRGLPSVIAGLDSTGHG